MTTIIVQLFGGRWDGSEEELDADEYGFVEGCHADIVTGETCSCCPCMHVYRSLQPYRPDEYRTMQFEHIGSKTKPMERQKRKWWES